MSEILTSSAATLAEKLSAGEITARDLCQQCLTAIEANAAAASYFETKDLDLLDLIDWMRQTVHRAHHDGPLNECRKSVCHAALDRLALDGRSRLGAGGEG